MNDEELLKLSSRLAIAGQITSALLHKSDDYEKIVKDAVKITDMLLDLV